MRILKYIALLLVGCTLIVFAATAIVYLTVHNKPDLSTMTLCFYEASRWAIAMMGGVAGLITVIATTIRWFDD